MAADNLMELRLEEGKARIRWLKEKSEAPLTLEAIETMISGLVQIRMRMSPEVPREIKLSGPHHMTEPDPIWRMDGEAMTGDPLMHLRHSGFGWTHWLLPRHEARNLALALQRFAEAPAPTDQRRPT